MPFSYAQYAGNGSATTFSVPFPYLLKAHVKLFYGYNLTSGAFTSELVDGVGFTWTSGTQVQTTVAPAVGQTLTIVRQTPSNALVVQWQDGSNLVAEDLQDSSLQNLYSVQEQEDVVSLSAAQSATAAAAAAAAVTTANAASTTANGIAGTANTALSNSSAAVTTANAASTTANAIAGTANTALSNSSAAVTTANAASATATAAQTTANGIAGTANTALSNSNAAVTTANAANATANGIAGTANTALATANTAVTTANAATTTANGIAGTANTALANNIPAGTVMLFQQNSAPTGWTKLTTHDNKALRVVSGTAGTGGSTAFTSVFASRTPGGSVSGSNSGGGVNYHTLSWNEMPSHNHTAYAAANDVNEVGSQGWPTNNNHQAFRSTDRNRDYAINNGAIGGAGSNWSHAHGFSPSSWSGSFSGSAMDFAVAYVDVIFASKN